MSIELSIRNMMNNHYDFEDIIEMLLNQSVSRRITKEELISIANFFVHSGMHKDYFRQFSRRFGEKEMITWTSFAEILLANKIKTSKEVINAIYKGCAEYGELNELALCAKWVKRDKRFKEIRRNLWQHKLESIDEKRKKLRQKIDYFKNQRLINDEKKAIEKYLLMFPEDTSLQEELQEFKERQARAVLNRRNEETNTREISHHDFPVFNKKDEEFSEIIFQFAIEKCQAKPHLSLDFAIMFIFFEMHNKALKIIELAPESKSAAWLKLELLVLSDENFTALTEIEKMEKTYADDSDISFALAYLKARAYNLLNQKSDAVDLLRSIIKIRPQYRAAQSLLNEILEESQ